VKVSSERCFIHRHSLRTKIIAWSAIPTALVLVAVAWAVLQTYQGLTEDLVMERDQELTRLIARELERQLTDEAELVSLLARTPFNRSGPGYSFVLEQVSSVIKPRIGAGGQAYLVDSNGRIIYHTRARYIGDNIADREIVPRVLGGETGALRTTGLDGQKILASFAPVSGIGWGLVAEEDWDRLILSSQTYRQMLLLLLSLAVVAPSVVITISARHITRPISRLITAAQRVAGGDFDQTINVSTRDELEELARQFNLMTAHLQSSHATLERKVADRTKELAALNAVSASVNASLDLDTTLDRALDELLDLLQVEIGEIWLLDEEQRTLVLHSRRGFSPETPQPKVHCNIEGTLQGQTLSTGRLLVCEDVATCDLPGWGPDRRVRAFVICPLQAKGQQLGTLGLATRRGPRHFAENERELLQAVSRQVGVAIDKTYLHQKAQELAVMEERNRLARDLHDSVTQSLYGVTLFGEAAARLLAGGNTELARQHLQELQVTAQEALREMRLLVFELRPPVLGEAGLRAALQTRLEGVEQRTGIETALQVVGQDRRFAPEVEEGLYRIAQEALNNALKHAQADHVHVLLCQDRPRIILQVTDDGIGFDLAAARRQGGVGLKSMEERAAALGTILLVRSEPGAGTRVRVEVS
jgi:nitrate/nitrite-specific signal transduction histidine kinase